jgi:N-terminal acetyltransferase B complex non-catalytic subunit
MNGLFPPVSSSDIATGSTPSQEAVVEVAAVTELFEEVATADGRHDRSGLLALIELEHRTQTHGLSNGLLSFVHIDSSQPPFQTIPG